MLPEYAALGLDGVAVFLQGGLPTDSRDFCTGDLVADPPGNVTTAILPDGSLDPAWMARADRLIRAAADEGMVVILGVVYQRQEQHLADPAEAVATVARWVAAQGHDNVLLEVANEAGSPFYDDAPLFAPSGIHTLVAAAKAANPSLPVGSSFRSDVDPGCETGEECIPDAYFEVADFIALHGNGVDTDEFVARIDGADARFDGPVLIDEDLPPGGWSASKAEARVRATVCAGAGTGYYQQGSNAYAGVDGFQSVPADWSITGPKTTSWFAAMAGQAVARRRRSLRRRAAAGRVAQPRSPRRTVRRSRIRMRIAPTTEPMRPAAVTRNSSPKSTFPRKPPTSEPASPSPRVPTHPIASRPGTSRRAIAPATRPMSSQTMIPTMPPRSARQG